MQELSVIALKAKIDARESFVLLDVREPFELAIAAIDGAINIPMNQIAARITELDPDADTCVLCRSGGRSGSIAGFLLSQGFTNVKNVSGGILAWATDVDTTLTQY